MASTYAQGVVTSLLYGGISRPRSRRCGIKTRVGGGGTTIWFRVLQFTRTVNSWLLAVLIEPLSCGISRQGKRCFRFRPTTTGSMTCLSLQTGSPLCPAVETKRYEYGRPAQAKSFT